MWQPKPAGVKGVLIGLCLSVAMGIGLFPAAATASNPIVIENQQPGTTSWQITLAGTDKAGQIKGYTSAASVNKGGNISFYVSVKPAQTYTIDVYRIGWYQGLGGRLMQHIGPLAGVTQSTCPTDPTTGMIQCNWTRAYTLATQTSWTSGVYLALLTNAQNYQNYMVFVVRDDDRVADLVYQQPVMTDQAYNNYPDDGLTGKSLYDYNSYGAKTITGTTAAAKVSFDRPYSNDGDGSGGDFLQYEITFVRWLETSGYDVTYSTDLDTHTNGGRLLNYRGFLSVGHNEYWSRPMYDAVVAARDAGVNLGFFGADAVYWQVRLEPSTSGVPNRVLVCYKNADIDPIADPALKTVLWRDPPLDRPEQTLVGVQFTSAVQWNSRTGLFGTYVVTNSGNWVYAGTGFKDGDTVPGIVGYEADRFFSEYPGPTAVSGTYTLLSHSPYTGDYGNSAVYQAPSGAWVFATGSMTWNWALDHYCISCNTDLVDPRIQRTTKNVLDRFVAGSGQPDFAITATPSSQTVTAGGSTSYSVTITPTGGFTGQVALTVSGLPSGASGTFTPNPATTSSALSATTSPGTPSGTYTLTITGSSGTLTHATAVSLTVQAAPTGITVTAPNTAVSWQVTTQQNITFTHNQGVGQAINIDVSRDGGSTWTPITTFTTTSATTGTYPWVVTGPPTTQARIRVTAAANPQVTDTSDVNFAIVNPTITVTAPNKGANWRIGDTNNVTFTHTMGAGQTVNIDVSRDGGATWSRITTFTTTSAASETYPWVVSAPATKQARIRVTWTVDPSVTGSSSGNFTIRR